MSSLAAISATLLAAASGFGAESFSTPFATDIATELRRVAASGGGRVTIPAGEWRTGPLELGSNVELHLNSGARLVFPDDPQLYKKRIGMYEGLMASRPAPLIGAFGATNVAVTGKGELFAETGYWERNHKSVQRPCFMQFIDCAKVRVEDVRIRNSPNWTMHFALTDDVTVRGVDSRALGRNNDGIDLDSVNGALIENCTLDQGDDAICMKSGKNMQGRLRNRPTRNVTIRNCTVGHGHTLLGIGSELSGGVENVLLENCDVTEEVWRVLLIKTNRARGGFARNITVRNVKAKRAKCAILGIMSDYQSWRPENRDESPELTAIENILVENVGCERAWYAYGLEGDEKRPPRRITLKDCSVKHPERGFGHHAHIDGLKTTNVIADPEPLAVWCDDADSLYPAGQTATFKIASYGVDGRAAVRLTDDDGHVVSESAIELSRNAIAEVKGTRPTPGFLVLTVDCGNVRKQWGAAFDWDLIPKTVRRPVNFR